MNRRKGISLIVLVITILVMIILSGVVIVSLQKNNPIERAKTAREMENLKAIETEISTFQANALSNDKKGKDLLPLKKNSSGDLISASDVFNKEELAKIPNELRQIMYRLQVSSKGEDYTIDKVDFSTFYVVDENAIPSVGAYKNRFLLHAIDYNYILLSLDGIKYNGKVHYIALPFGKEIGSQFIAGDNNTFILSPSGQLRAIGQKNKISGQDIDNYSGYRTVEYLSKFPGYKKFKTYWGAAFVIDSEDNLYVWGRNTNNRLGVKDSATVMQPKHILEGKKVKDVWSGVMNTYVVTTDNKLYAVGTNTKGALGQGNTDVYDDFVEIKSIPEVANISNIFLSRTEETNNAIVVCNMGSEKKVYGLGEDYMDMFGAPGVAVYRPLDITERHPELRYADQVGFTGQNLSFRRGTKLYIAGRGSMWSNAPFENHTAIAIEVANNVAKISDAGDTRVYIGTDGYVYRCSNKYNVGSTTKVEQGYVKSTTNIFDVNCEIDCEGKISKNKNELYDLKFDSVNKQIIYSKLPYHIKKIEVNNYMGEPMYDTTKGNTIATYWEITTPTSRIQITPKTVKDNIKSLTVDGDKIHLIDTEGVLWDSLTTKATDITEKSKKVLMGDETILLTESGKVYRKGTGKLGGTGDVNFYSKFTPLKYSNENSVINAKNIFRCKARNDSVCAFVLTNDNKLYYTGTLYDDRIPNKDIDADTGLTTSKVGATTKYLTRISSPVLNSIVGDIKDIQSLYTIQSGNWYNTTTILTNSGEIYTYGSDIINGHYKQVTDYTKLNLPAKVRMIKNSNLATFALLENGDVYAWGKNTSGEFGNGKLPGRFYYTPFKLELPGKTVEMEIGNGFSIFGMADGSVYASGRNDFGQLGTGDTISTINFVPCKTMIISN